MSTLAWVEDIYTVSKVLGVYRVQVVGWLLGKRQRYELEKMLHVRRSLDEIVSGEELAKGSFLWGKPVVWSDAVDCAIPLFKQGVEVVYDDEQDEHRIAFPFRQREDGTWVSP